MLVFTNHREGQHQFLLRLLNQYISNSQLYTRSNPTKPKQSKQILGKS